MTPEQRQAAEELARTLPARDFTRIPLTPRDVYILTLCYRVTPPASLAYLAAEFDVTNERVSQCRSKALRKLLEATR